MHLRGAGVVKHRLHIDGKPGDAEVVTVEQRCAGCPVRSEIGHNHTIAERSEAFSVGRELPSGDADAVAKDDHWPLGRATESVGNDHAISRR